MSYKTEEALRNITQEEWNKFTINQKYDRVNAARKYTSNPLSHLVFDAKSIVKERSRVMNERSRKANELKGRSRKVTDFTHFENPQHTSPDNTDDQIESDDSIDESIMSEIQNFLNQSNEVQSNLKKLIEISNLRALENKKLRSALKKSSADSNEAKDQLVKTKSELEQARKENVLIVQSLNIEVAELVEYVKILKTSNNTQMGINQKLSDEAELLGDRVNILKERIQMRIQNIS